MHAFIMSLPEVHAAFAGAPLAESGGFTCAILYTVSSVKVSRGKQHTYAASVHGDYEEMICESAKYSREGIHHKLYYVDEMNPDAVIITGIRPYEYSDQYNDWLIDTVISNIVSSERHSKVRLLFRQYHPRLDGDTVDKLMLIACRVGQLSDSIIGKQYVLSLISKLLSDHKQAVFDDVRPLDITDMI